MIQKMLIVALFALSTSAMAQNQPATSGEHHHEKNPTVKADAQAVDNACTAEAKTAGCGDEVVGKGLLKCIHAYKHAHKDFKVSDGCHAAIEKLHSDKKEIKAEHGK